MFDVPILDADEKSSPLTENSFTDIDDHPFASAITTLASLGILNTQTTKFYPDNYLRHYDFTILFVNALLASRGETLPIVPSISSFVDVDASASYLPQLTYAADR